MATYVKSALTRIMATDDCLIHFEATVNAPGAPTQRYRPVKSVATTSVPCGKR